MLIACSIPNATDTLSEYAILTACPQQHVKSPQCYLYTYMACLVLLTKIQTRGSFNVFEYIQRQHILTHRAKKSSQNIGETTGWTVGIRGLIPSRTKEFFSSVQHPNGSGTPSASYTVITEGNILVIKLWGVNLTNYRHLAPRL